MNPVLSVWPGFASVGEPSELKFPPERMVTEVCPWIRPVGESNPASSLIPSGKFDDPLTVIPPSEVRCAAKSTVMAAGKTYAGVALCTVVFGSLEQPFV